MSIWQDPKLMNQASFGADVILFFLFGVGFPWLLLKVFKGVPYLQGLKEIMWAAMGMSSLLFLFVTADIISLMFGSGYPGDIWIKATSAFVLLVLCVICHVRWPWLLTLYPKQTLLQEKARNARLINKLQIIDDTSPCAKFESRSGTITDANLAAMQLTGYSRHELIGMSGRQIIHPDDMHYFEELVLQRKTQTYECRILHKQHCAEVPRIIPVEVHTAHAPYDEELRLTFLTDMTKYVEERDRRLREVRVERAHGQFTQAARELQQTASQIQ
jgi:PAS domain S-box-containing protein